MAQNPNIKDILAKVQNIGNQSSGQASSLPSSIGVPQYQPKPTFGSIGSPTINPLTGLLHSEDEEAKKLNQIQSQVANLATRLDYAGFADDVDNIEDSRNFLEKFFNLPEKQNWLFDVFELINRPQQAIFGLLEEVTDSDKIADGSVDAGGAFIEGLTGEKRTFAGQILRNVFQDGQEEDGSFDWTDVAGFAMDIFLDPADIALIPLTGGLSYLKKVPKTTKVFSEVDDIARAGISLMKRTYSPAGSIQASLPAFRSGQRVLSSAVDLAKGAEKVIEPLADIAKLPSPADIARKTTGYVNEAILYSKAIEKTSLTGFVWKNVGVGLKSGAKMSTNLAEIALRGLDQKLGDAFAVFKKGALENFATTGKTIQRKTTEFFYKRSEANKRVMRLMKQTNDELATIFTEKVAPNEYLQAISSKFDITNEQTIARSLTENADEINKLFGDDKLAGKIADGILNRQPGEKTIDIVRSQIDNAYKQAIMNTYEFTELARKPLSWNDLVNKVVNGNTSQIAHSDTAERVMRTGLGDKFDDFVEVVDIDTIKMIRFKKGQWSHQNYTALRNMGADNFKTYDNLSFMRDKQDALYKELGAGKEGVILTPDTPANKAPLTRKKPELGPNESMMKDFSGNNSARIITNNSDDISSIRVQGQFTNADLLATESLILYDIRKKGHANLSFELPDGKTITTRIDSTDIPFNVQINRAIGEEYGKKYTPFNKNSKNITDKDMEVLFETFDGVADDMLADVDFDYTDAKYEAWFKDITSSFVRKDGRVRLTQKLYHNLDSIVQKSTPEEDLVKVLRKFDDEYGTMFEAKMFIGSELDAPASIIKKLDIEPTPSKWIYDIPKKRATTKDNLDLYQKVMKLSEKGNSSHVRAKQFLDENQELLQRFFGDDFDDFYHTIKNGTKPESSIFGETVAFIADKADGTPLGKHFKTILEEQGVKGDVATYLSSGLDGVKKRLTRQVDKYLQDYKFGIGLADEKPLSLVEHLGDADKVIYNQITSNNTKNFSEAYSYFFEKYDYLEHLVDEKVKKAVLGPGSGSYDALTGQWVAGLDDTRNFVTNQIPVGTFYTPADIEEFNRFLKNEAITDGIKVFKKNFEESQRVISHYVFGDAEALGRNSMSGYIPHVKTNKILSKLEGLTQEQANVRTKALLDEVTKNTGMKFGSFEDMFVFGKTGAFKDRAFEMSAREANNIRTAYFRHSVAGSDWFKTDIPEDFQTDVLEYFNKDMFSENVMTSFGDFITYKADNLIENKRNSEILLALAFGNPTKESSYFRLLKSDVAVPANYTRLTGDEVANISNTIRQLRQLGGENRYLDELAKHIKPALGDNAKSVVVMEDHLAKMFKITRKGKGDTFSFMDTINNFFKAGKVASPAFNARNVVGNWYNMWVSGIPAHQIPKYWTESLAMHKQFPKIDEKVLSQGIESLSKDERVIYDIVSHFKVNGFFERENLLRLNDLGSLEAIRREGTSKLAKGMKATGVDAMMEGNLRMNIMVDNTSRMALYRYALDNPEYLNKLGFAQGTEGAMDAVRLALFDPNDLSFFEKDVMKRLIPFYTWSRQNLVFQAQNLATNSSPYYKTWKTFEALWNSAGVDTGDLQEYERDQLYIPIPWMSKDGKYTALKLSLPLADLIEFSTPGEAFRRAMSSTTPLLRAPFEAVTGNTVFTGQPIERYEGEMSKNIPFLSKKAEWAVSQVGVDVPLKVASGAVGSVIEAVKGTNVDTSEAENLFSNERFVRSATNALNISAPPRDVRTNQLYQQYEKLDRLNALMRKQKEAGNTIPTLDDIAKGNSSLPKISKQQDQLASILEIVNKYKNR